MSLKSEFIIGVSTQGDRDSKQRVDGVTESTRKLSTENERLQGSLGKTGAATDDMNKKLSASSGRLKVIGRDINRYVTLPLVAFTGIATKFALDLNKGLGQVQTLIPGTGDRINELRDAVVGMARDSGRSFDDLNAGLYRTISVFQDGEDTVARMNVAVRAGIAGYASTAEAVQLLASVTRAYGDTSAEAVAKVSDLAFEAVRLGDTTFPALASAMQVATDRADRLNVSQEELFASFATLTGVTGDASMVATQFRSAMDSLLRPTESLRTLFDSLGYSSAEAAIEAEGMAGILKTIAEEAERTGKPLQDFITRKEGITFASRLAGAQLGDYNMRLREMHSAQGATNRAFEGATEGIGRYNFELNKSKMVIQTAFSEIGQNLLPAVVALAHSTGFLVESFSNLHPAIQGVLLGLGAMVAVLGSIVRIKGVLLSMKMAGFFSGMGAAVVGLNGKLTITASLLAGIKLIFLPLLAVVAAGALVFTAYQRNQRREMELNTEAMDSQRSALRRLREAQDDAARNRRGISRRNEIALEFEEEGIPSNLLSPRGGGLSSVDQASVRVSLDSISPEDIRDHRLRWQRELEVLSEEVIQGQALMREAGERMSEIVSNNSDLMTRDMRLNLSLTGQSLTDKIEELRQRSREITQAIQNAYNAQREQEILLHRYGQDMPQTQRLEHEGIRDRLKQEQVTLSEESTEVQRHRRMLSDQQIINREAQKVNITLAEEQEHRRGLLKLTEQQASAEGGRAVLKTWQEFFTEITSVDVLEQSGTNAARTFENAMANELRNSQTLSIALGEAFDASGFFGNRLTQLRTQIQEMLAIDPSDIAGGRGFSWTSAFEMDREGRRSQDQNVALQKVIDTYRETLNSFYTETGKDMERAWKDQDTELSRYIESLERAGIATHQLQNNQQTYMGRLQEAHQLMSEAVSKGISEQDKAYEDLAAGIAKAERELMTYGRSFEEVMSASAGMESIQSRMFSGLRDLVKGSREELESEIDKIMEGPATKEEKTKLIAKLTEEFKELDTFLAHTLTFTVNLLGAAINTMASELVNVGSAFREAGYGSDEFKNSISDMGMELLKAIPQLLISAGIALLAVNLPVGLALIGLGLAGSFGVGYVESWRQEGSEERLAKGGIINSPTRLGRNALAGEAGPEAVLPLSRTSSGDLGVQVSGGAVTMVEPQVNIYNYADVQVEQQTDDNGDIQIYIKRAVKAIIADGSVDREMRNRYSIRTSGRA